MATLNIQDLSAELGTSPRTARKFLRSVTPVEEQPGKGKRWSIEKRQVRSLKKQFEQFESEHTNKPADEDAPETSEETPNSED